MSRPPINPDKTAAGIALDPQTLERVIPESRRPDGTVRKQIKIRPGFTPQEDVKRFRGTKQAQMDSNVLPKGHIIGWAPPPTSNTASSSTKPLSKSAKKNAKRKEKRETQKETVPDNWDDEDEGNGKATTPTSNGGLKSSTPNASSAKPGADGNAETEGADKDDTKDLTDKLEKLDVK
ncbi:hypothetical protein BDQ12DRAFT_731599 [Crucibulum laeve]|uniref:WIBG Mago-binding domain-containing protein n=1 Tax=Crucibulum laeve TaxID=68775 RepID=A0A5C3MQT3_9AGAR|nr:hypothetical protein BDQ12DRAFT_731599 [Crucibulum laeve]